MAIQHATFEPADVPSLAHAALSEQHSHVHAIQVNEPGPIRMDRRGCTWPAFGHYASRLRPRTKLPASCNNR